MGARPHRSDLRLVSLSQAAPGLEAQAFLRCSEGQERFYWRDANSPLILAGFGSAAELKAWGGRRFREIERQARRLFDQAWLRHLSPLAIPRLFGGFAFRDDFVPDNTWAAFYPAHFILPHFQLAQRAAESWLTINTLVPVEEDPEQSEADLRQALAARYAWLLACSGAGVEAGPVCPAPIDLRYPMPAATWNAMVGDAVRQMQAGKFRKVVLARASEIHCGGPIQVGRALQHLDEQYPGCYRFLFEPQPRHAFFGASPELLVSVAGTELSTMALAASIRRGKTPAEDAQLAAHLLNDQKERYEHQLVAQELRRRLLPQTRQLSLPPVPEVLRLRNIQHLYTPVKGRLKRPAGVLRVLASLHPTPALGGSPRHLAMDYIRQAEPVPRGWYAAPIGWLGPDLDGVFAVAIRSAIVQEQRAWLYAGAGIVAASLAEQEWKETELKFRPILQALDVEGIS